MKKNNPKTTEAEETVSAPDLDSGFSGIRQRAHYHTRQVIDHLWGPTGSIILHILILVALVRLVAIGGRDMTADISVTVIDPDTVDLEEIERELEDLPDLEFDIPPPEAEIMMEQPPDAPRPDPRPQEDIAALDIMTDVQSPLIMRGLLAGRSAEGRSAMLRRFAGRRAAATEAAVMRALEWLKEHQLEDGSWQGEGTASSKAAMTGLGLLTFLAHGETPSSERFGPTVERAIRFLVDSQRQDGAFRGMDRNWYAHGIATYALSEAYALTRIPSVRTAMEQGIERIMTGQQATGAFNYGLRRGDNRRDTSMMAWQAQAMKAAFISGAEIDGLEEAMQSAIQGFLLNFGEGNRMFAYAPTDPGRPNSGRPSNTAMAVLSLQLLGAGGEREVRDALSAIQNENISWGSSGSMGGWPLYTWYYFTQAVFHQGGSPWERWNRQFSDALVNAQNEDGSWTPFSERESAYGPVYGTTFSALTLMVYYRFLPTFQPIEIEAPPTQEREDDVEIEIIRRSPRGEEPRAAAEGLLAAR